MICMETVGFDKEHPRGLGERRKIGRNGITWRERKKRGRVREYYKRRINPSDHF